MENEVGLTRPTESTNDDNEHDSKGNLTRFPCFTLTIACFGPYYEHNYTNMKDQLQQCAWTIFKNDKLIGIRGLCGGVESKDDRRIALDWINFHGHIVFALKERKDKFTLRKEWNQQFKKIIETRYADPVISFGDIKRLRAEFYYPMKHDINPFFIPDEAKEWFMKIRPQAKKVNTSRPEKTKNTDDGIMTYNKDAKKISAQQIIANYAYDFGYVYYEPFRQLMKPDTQETINARQLIDHLVCLGLHFRKLPIIEREIEELFLSPESLTHLVRFKN